MKMTWFEGVIGAAEDEMATRLRAKIVKESIGAVLETTRICGCSENQQHRGIAVGHVPYYLKVSRD